MTTIQEGLQHSREQVQAEEAIAERYPATRVEALPGDTRVWTSRQVLEDATDIRILGNHTVMAAILVEVQGVPVFNPAYMNLYRALELFKEKDPEAYQRFVQVVATDIKTRHT